MNFSPTEEQRAIQETFHRFAEREIRPRAGELDEKGQFPRDLFRRAGEIGMFALRYPEPHGRGADTVSLVLAVEELAWGSLGFAASCTMQSLMGTTFVHRFGTDALRSRLLDPALRGERVGAICMTEPEAGSDLGSVRTRAERAGDGWTISGTKTWVTSAPIADFFTVLARTGEKALSFFLVEAGAPGLRLGRDIDKLGVRSSPTSEVFFESTPATALLGEEGAGMGYLRDLLAEIRVVTAALALGVGRAAHEEAKAWATTRRQFGRPVGDFQAVQAHLAEMAVDLEAARRLTYWAAWRRDQGLPSATEGAMAKLFASEAATRVCDRASRVLASWGYATESAVARYVRDVRFTLLGGGTSEILRGAIARGM